MKEEEVFSCKAILRKSDMTGWTLEINDASLECLACLKEIGKKMGSHARKYLKKRIETSNHEIRKILELWI